MEYRQIEYFLKICEYGSMSKAAEKLFISQQGLSKSMDSLEKDLGAPLFYRNGRNLALTPCGQMFRSECHHLISHRDSVLEKISFVHDRNQSILTITFFSGMFAQYPDHFFEDIINAYPDFSFRLVSYYDNDSGRETIPLNSDLIFTTSPLEMNELELLYQSQRTFYALMDKDHPYAGKKILRPEDLKDQYILMLNSDFPDKDQLLRTLRAHNIEVASQLSDADLPLCGYLVRNYHAVSFFAGPEEAIPEGCVRVPLADTHLLYRCYIYGKPGLQPAPIQQLVEKVSAFRALY